MNNKELLSNAAIAAGYIGTVTEYPNGFAEMGLSNHFDQRGSNVWNPLINNGQALELAVTLAAKGHGLNIFMHSNELTVYGPNDAFLCEYKEDAYAATRHAIVHAAAKIGVSIITSHTDQNVNDAPLKAGSNL